MTVLRWRPYTRAGLLRALDRSFVGVGVSVVAELLDEPTDSKAQRWAQRLEDVRLAVPLTGEPGTLLHRRRLGSTVWHTSRECAAYPSEPPYEEQVGVPGLGYACRECRQLTE